MIIDSRYLYFRGRVALAELLIACGAKKGDFIAIQAYTCSAVPEAAFATQAKPLYIDVTINGVTMSTLDLERKLKKNTNVKIIIIQHTFGIVADIKKLSEIAKKYNLMIIEDCCHSINSSFEDIEIGNYSDASFYSFEWGKPIPLGLGGAIKINNPSLLPKINNQYKEFNSPTLRSELQLIVQIFVFTFLYNPKTYWTIKKLYHLMSRIGAIKGNHSSVNLSQKTDEFNWKISRIIQGRLKRKMSHLKNNIVNNKKVVKNYEDNLICCNGATALDVLPASKTVYVRYPVWVSDKKNFMQYSLNNNIEVSDWYNSPIHPHKGINLKKLGYESGSCPNAELSCNHIISLPISLALNKRSVKKLSKFFEND